METWDVFHNDRLEVERALTTAEVRAALARGALRDDDLIRPSGLTAPWGRLAGLPALLVPEPASPEPFEAPVYHAAGVAEDRTFPPAFPDDDDDDVVELVVADEDDDVELVVADEDLGEFDIDPDDRQSILAVPVDAEPDEDELEEEYDPLDEDEAIAEFTLSRGDPERVEELDLAAMVDVAFQLVLFFLVTATTILYKTLEVPKPNPESRPEGVAQGKSRTLDDLKKVFILVEIDPSGAMKIDSEPVAAQMPALIERLRVARESTGRKEMLVSADFGTQHRNVVLALDAANEIGLGIALARPQPPAQAPAVPRPPPAASDEPAGRG